VLLTLLSITTEQQILRQIIPPNTSSKRKTDPLSPQNYTFSRTMFVLPTLIYSLLGATLSRASHPRVMSGHTLNASSTNRTDVHVQTIRDSDVGINCDGSPLCPLVTNSRGLPYIALLISRMGDDFHFDDGKQIGASFLQRAIGVEWS
jgi:hypothetical protein